MVIAKEKSDILKSLVIFSLFLISALNLNTKNNYIEIQEDNLNGVDSPMSSNENNKDAWEYEDWRQYVINLGYEIGQLNDAIINHSNIQYNIHIATIVHWGKYNGSLTKAQIIEL